MFAIVEVAGQQFKVEKESRLFVHRLDEKEGEKIYLDKVLLIDNDGKVNIGTPVIKNARVSATVQSHLKGDKVQVFKKKKRKGYQVLNGHRQYFTEIVINNIEEKAATATKAPAKEADKKQPAATKTTTEKKPATSKTTTSASGKTTAAGTKPATSSKTTAAKTGTAKKTTEGKKGTAGKSTPATKKVSASAKKATPAKEKKEAKPSTPKPNTSSDKK
jgi:large subunit ribosomal protein L21